MRAFLISLLALAVTTPAWAQDAPVSTAPASAQAQAAIPVVAAPPAPDTAMSADQAVDPLADLITRSGSQTTDEEDAAPQAPAAAHKPTILPLPAPEPPPSAAVTEAYDLRIKGSIVAAQGLQGPLDGGWSIDGPDGATLYALQIVDKVGGYDGLEGAWRDVRRGGAVGSTGLIDFVDRSSGGFLARFSPRAGQLATLDLTPRGDGSWGGKLNDNGVETPVTARRVAQATLPPGYVAQGGGPVVWPRPATPRLVAASPAKTPACSTRGKKGKALKTAKARCAAVAKKGKSAVSKGKRGVKGPALRGKASAKKSGKKKRR